MAERTHVSWMRWYREEKEKAEARARYWKLHEQGKTEQAQKDMARLAIIRQQREEAAKRREAEKQAKEEEAKRKLEMRRAH
jgi:Casein kinase substrate phosphoprotein PP28